MRHFDDSIFVCLFFLAAKLVVGLMSETRLHAMHRSAAWFSYIFLRSKLIYFSWLRPANEGCLQCANSYWSSASLAWLTWFRALMDFRIEQLKKQFTSWNYEENLEVCRARCEYFVTVKALSVTACDEIYASRCGSEAETRKNFTWRNRRTTSLYK